jgi:hypothetical protein
MPGIMAEAMFRESGNVFTWLTIKSMPAPAVKNAQVS